MTRGCFEAGSTMLLGGRAKRQGGSSRVGCEMASESPQVRSWGQPRDRLTPLGALERGAEP